MIILLYVEADGEILLDKLTNASDRETVLKLIEKRKGEQRCETPMEPVRATG